MVVGQVWRDPKGCQVRLARLLRGVDVRSVDDEMGRAAGVLIGRAGTKKPINATLVLVVHFGARLLTSDPQDSQCLASAPGRSVAIIRC
jgi:hypothetical protein